MSEQQKRIEQPMSNSAFLIGPKGLVPIDAGHGETPTCPQAKFSRGDVVKVRNLKSLQTFPREAVVAVAIPPHFSPTWALHDLVGEPRPLMAQVGSRKVTYILVCDGDPTPYLAKEEHLLPSGKEAVTIGSIRREAANG